MKWVKFILIFLFIFSLSFTSAQPPFEESTGDLRIVGEAIPTIPANQSHHFHFHVSNSTNFIDNSTGTCGFTLILPNGSFNYKNKDIPYHPGSENEWGITLTGSNFTRTGSYNYVTECNTSSQVAFVAFEFMVTPSGTLFTDALSIPLFLPIIFMMLLSLFFFFLTHYVKREEYKFTFLLFGGFFTIMAISFGIISSREVLYGFPILYNFVNNFYIIFIITLQVSAILIPIAIMFFVIKRAFDKRGYNIGK